MHDAETKTTLCGDGIVAEGEVLELGGGGEESELTLLRYLVVVELDTLQGEETLQAVDGGDGVVAEEECPEAVAGRELFA